MAKKFSIIILLALCLWGITSTVVLAADPAPNGLVTCGRTGIAQAQATDCNFIKLIDMINLIIKYLIYIAMPLAAISFAYAGFLYLFAGDNASNVSKAKTIFMDVGIGLVLVLSAWLIFKLIETTFLSTKTDSNGNTYKTFLN